MPKAISCGFIIFDRHTGAILGCHPTGQRVGPEMSYDIPKGHMEEGEEPLVTALRELYEETGLVLPQGYPVHRIGLVPYQKQKSLYLFSTYVENLPSVIKGLKCTSTFTDSFGNEKPEIDGYAAITDPSWFFKNMQPHIRAEMERAHCDRVALVEATVENERKITLRLPLTPDLERKCRDTLVYIKDSNMYPDGIFFEVKLPSGKYASVEMDDLQDALVNTATVDIDGSIGMLDTFDVQEWFDQALAPEALR